MVKHTKAKVHVGLLSSMENVIISETYFFDKCLIRKTLIIEFFT